MTNTPGIGYVGYGGLTYNNVSGIITFARVTPANIRGEFSASSGLTYDSAKGAITGNQATTTALGVASFDADDFSVTAGAVSIKAGSLTAASINNNTITYGKLQQVATANRLLGSNSANSNIAEVTVNTSMINNNAVTYAKMQKVVTANRLLGSTTANAAVTEVQVSEAMIASNVVSAAKLKTPVTLTIKNSAGTVLFTMTGAGA